MNLQRKILGAIVLAMLAGLVWLRPLDAPAVQYTESGLKRAFATFAAARAMNAALSVLQSGTVNLQLGAGASVQLGAVLDPLDDLVEQFSALMLAATISFATQRLLIELCGAWPVSALLSVLLLAWAVFRWQGRIAPGWLPRLALGLLCLRLAVPVAALGSEATYRMLLAREYDASQMEIGSAKVPGVEIQSEAGVIDKLKAWWSQSTEFDKKIAALKAAANGWVEHMVRLSAVFLVQTVVLPLLFLWAMLWFYHLLCSWEKEGRK